MSRKNSYEIGKRVVEYINLKIAEKQKEWHRYCDVDMAQDIGIAYTTMKRWMDKGWMDQMNLENLRRLIAHFGPEFVIYVGLVAEDALDTEKEPA